MKTTANKLARDPRHEKAQNNPGDKKGRGKPSRYFTGNNPDGDRSVRLQATINDSLRLVSQRQQAFRLLDPNRRRSEESTQSNSAPGIHALKAGTGPLQRAGMEDEKPMPGKLKPAQRQGIEEEELKQGKFISGPAPTRPAGEYGTRENRTGMPDQLKSGIETLSGVSLDGVQVHYNSPRPAQLQALAYTQGKTIHVGPGQERHLPHEAWHAVQQSQGRVKPSMDLKGSKVNDDSRLENEADLMGAKASQLKASPIEGTWSGDFAA
jgi:hypothetical protein